MRLLLLIRYCPALALIGVVPVVQDSLLECLVVSVNYVDKHSRARNEFYDDLDSLGFPEIGILMCLALEKTDDSSLAGCYG